MRELVLNEPHRLVPRSGRGRVERAAGYYELESPGLGVAFLEDIRLAVDHISRVPAAATLLLGRVRRKLLLRFPYAVVYSLRESGIRILAIAHHKRRPFYWRVRR